MTVTISPPANVPRVFTRLLVVGVGIDRADSPGSPPSGAFAAAAWSAFGSSAPSSLSAAAAWPVVSNGKVSLNPVSRWVAAAAPAPAPAAAVGASRLLRSRVAPKPFTSGWPAVVGSPAVAVKLPALPEPLPPVVVPDELPVVADVAGATVAATAFVRGEIRNALPSNDLRRAATR